MIRLRGTAKKILGKGMALMYVTHSELIQIGIFIVTLVGVCYTIMHGKGK